MRAVVQRVKQASVSVEGAVVGAIQTGILVYLGVGAGDNDEALEWLCSKILSLRIFADESGKMSHSVLDIGGAALIVSQFTLYGDLQKGNRPSFTSAEQPERAKQMFERFCQRCSMTVPVHTGIFGADMQVESVNDGPVTLWLERV
jgi:D-aminoacyl-tRNA deacylase